MLYVIILNYFYTNTQLKGIIQTGKIHSPNVKDSDLQPLPYNVALLKLYFLHFLYLVFHIIRVICGVETNDTVCIQRQQKSFLYHPHIYRYIKVFLVAFY